MSDCISHEYQIKCNWSENDVALLCCNPHNVSNLISSHFYMSHSHSPIVETSNSLYFSFTYTKCNLPDEKVVFIWFKSPWPPQSFSSKMFNSMEFSLIFYLNISVQCFCFCKYFPKKTPTICHYDHEIHSQKWVFF